MNELNVWERGKMKKMFFGQSNLKSLVRLKLFKDRRLEVKCENEAIKLKFMFDLIF